MDSYQKREGEISGLDASRWEPKFVAVKRNGATYASPPELRPLLGAFVS